MYFGYVKISKVFFLYLADDGLEVLTLFTCIQDTYVLMFIFDFSIQPSTKEFL